MAPSSTAPVFCANQRSSAMSGASRDTAALPKLMMVSEARRDATVSFSATAAVVSAPTVDAPILVVSQFTLYADTAKGRRPSWNAAASGTVAEPLVAVFAEALRGLGAHVETGVFGANMQVELVNDGPVTVFLEL